MVTFTSIDVVFNLLTMNTGGSLNGSFMVFAKEWIPQAINMLETKYSLRFQRKIIKAKFFQAPLPCEIRTLYGVFHNGVKLIPKNLDVPKSYIVTADSLIYTVPKMPCLDPLDKTKPDYRRYVEMTTKAPRSSSGWYIVNHNVVESNIEEGDLEVFFDSIPLDDNGFPLIPDNANYHMAVYWFLRAMLIGTGWKDPANFDYQFCYSEFERLGRRAINEIKYPSPERMESILPNLTNIFNNINWRNVVQ